MVEITNNEEIRTLTDLEHVHESPGMYAGVPNDIIPIETLVFERDRDDKHRAITKKFKINGILIKMIDEIMANAIDMNTKFPKTVTEITITFDKETGRISVHNNGPGFNIVQNDVLLGDNKTTIKRWSPEIACAQFKSGGNFNNTKKVTGGKNGIGMKLTNAFSKEFYIETYNAGKKYSQTFEDKLKNINPPAITKDKSGTGTLISFIPDYAYMKTSLKVVASDLEQLITARAYYAAAFLKAGLRKGAAKVTVTYNGVSILDDDADGSSFRKMIAPNPHAIQEFTIKGKTEANAPWHVTLLFGEFPGISNPCTSIINGIVSKSGNHITWIRNQIIAAATPKLIKTFKGDSKLFEGTAPSKGKAATSTTLKLKDSILRDNIHIMIMGFIPDCDWAGQAKDVVSIAKSKLEPYIIPPAQCRAATETIIEMVDKIFFADIPGKKATKKKFKHKKYTPAKEAGGPNSKYCVLLTPEGDSAETTARTGALFAGNGIGADFIGFFNLGGVIMNAMKNTKEVTRGGNAKIVRSDNLEKNETIKALVAILGLDYSKKYETEEEFKTIKYGQGIVAVVDEDLDGAGHIFGLLSAFFHQFWPALIQRNFIKRLATPVIRAMSSKKNVAPLEFFDQNSYREWATTMPPAEIAKYTINYYKGLGTMTPLQAREAFANFWKKIYYYDLDEEATKYFDVFYGKETSLRKTELGLPVDYTLKKISEKAIASKRMGATVGISTEQHMEISKHLRTDTKAYQLDNIQRKLPCYTDGLVEARRKVLATAFKVFKKESKVKVSTLVGEVVKRMGYHHGEASLQDTVVGMARDCLGAKIFPLLIPVGQFGTRHMAGKDAAAARYIFVRASPLATKLFPAADLPILDYVIDEGERLEPTFSNAVLPYSLMESWCIPATGWKIETTARDLKAIVMATRAAIESNGTVQPTPGSLPIYVDPRFKGELRTIKNIPGNPQTSYWVGKYIYDPARNTVFISEFPMGTNIKKWVKDHIKDDDPIIEDIYDRTSNDLVDVEVKLVPGAIELIKAKYGNANFDAIEEFFGLKASINHFITMVREDRTVREFKTYEEVFTEWFHRRKELYEGRMKRQALILKLKILNLENVIRFVQEFEGINMTKKAEAEMITLAKASHFIMFNATKLDNPGFIPTKDLEKEIIGGSMPAITKDPTKGYDSILESGITFDYLFNIRVRDFSDEATKKRQERLTALKKELTEIIKDNKPFLGAKTWLKEISEFVDVYEKGWEHLKE